MIKLSEISKGHVVYLFGEIISKGLFFVLLFCLGRYLTISEFGVFSLLFPLIQNLVTTASFGLSTSLLRFSFEKNISKDEVYSATLLSWCISLLFWFPILYISLNYTFISGYELYIYHFNEFVLPLLISMFCLGFSQILLETYRVEGKKFNFVLLNVFSRTCLFISIIVSISLGLKSSVYLIWFTSLGSLIVFVCSFVLYISYLRFSFNKDLIIKLLYFGFPVMFSPISVMLLHIGNRYVLNSMASSESVGIYSMSVSLVQVLALIPAVFNRAWVPVLFEKLNSRDAIGSFFKKTVYIYLFLFVLSCLSLEYVSKLLLEFTGNAQYTSGLKLFPVLIIGYLFDVLYTFSIDRFYYLKKLFLMLFLITISGLFNIFLTMLMVVYFKETGAAFAFSLSMALQATLFVSIAKKLDKIELPMKEIFQYIVIGIIGAFLIWYSLETLTFIETTVIYLLLIGTLIILFKFHYRDLGEKPGFTLLLSEQKRI